MPRDDGAETRERILEAATRLFVEHGYRGLSMREIADAVDLTKPAIYHHFADKEELFVAILKRYVERLSASIRQEQAAAASSIDALRRIIHTILAQPTEQQAVLRLATQEMVHLSESARRRFVGEYYVTFLGSIRGVIEAGIAAGELRAVDPAVAVWALLGMLYPYSNQSAPSPTPEIVDQVTGLFLHGIAA